jgi:hypothetical protein
MPYGDELHDGEHEAVIDRETFQRTQAILETRRECGRRRPRNPEYLLTGIIQCVCGGAYTPASTRARGKEYRYYRCVTRDKQGGEGCSARPLPAQAIEDFVVQRLRETVATPEMAAQVEAELLAQVERTRTSLSRQRRRLREHLPRKEQEYRRASEETLTAEGKAWAVAKERADFLAAELNEAEAQLRDVERKLAGLDQAEIDGLWVASMLRDFNQVWDVMTIENRGRLVRALVRRVVVDEDAGTCEVELLDVGHAIPEGSVAEASATGGAEPPTEQQVQP